MVDTRSESGDGERPTSARSFEHACRYPHNSGQEHMSPKAKWKVTDSASEKDEPMLRHVEKDVLIPKMMREKARELCSDKVQAFTKCCQNTGFLMVLKCREENAALKECLTGYYTDPAFYKECESEYLKQREEYKTTGIRPSQKQQRLPTSM